MITVLNGFPDNALGVDYIGHVTAEDYGSVLVPEIEKRLKRFGGVRLLVRFGSEFESLAPSAVWSDTKLGLSHWSEFSRIAVVSDVTWLRDAVLIFRPIIRYPVKIFDDSKFEAARGWLLEEEAA